MKNISLITLLTLCLPLWAQFPIKGQIENYKNSPVLVKYYQNGSTTLLKRVETDANGMFSLKFPTAYKGLLLIELSGGSFNVVANNEPLSFSLDIDDPSKNIAYTDGVNKKLNEYNEQQKLYDLKNNSYPFLLTYYTPEDAFYKAVEKEIARIDQLEPIKFADADLQYYVESKTTLENLVSKDLSHQEAMNIAQKHLLNDGSSLENYGFLNPYLMQYVTHAVSGAQTRQEAEGKIKEAVDNLLDKLEEESPRGQAVLVNIIPMLEGSGFTELARAYTQKAKDFTCDISSQLKNIIEAKDRIAVGKKAPNIIFEEKVKGKKSLYDIKAKQKLLVFYGSWCGHCQQEMPFIKDFYKDFKKKGGEIIAIALDLKKEDYLKMAGDMDWYNYSDLLKWDSPVVAQYGIDGTPTLILLDEDNKVVKIGSKISEFVQF